MRIAGVDRLRIFHAEVTMIVVGVEATEVELIEIAASVPVYLPFEIYIDCVDDIELAIARAVPGIEPDKTSAL